MTRRWTSAHPSAQYHFTPSRCPPTRELLWTGRAQHPKTTETSAGRSIYPSEGETNLRLPQARLWLRSRRLYTQVRRHPEGQYNLSSSDLTDKLARIKSTVTPLTLRKAEMTKEQLERRYHVMLPKGNARSAPLNLLDVVRWYDKQEPGAKAALDRAEPLTWLKHLLDKRQLKYPRLPWHLTALIMEEYVKAQLSHQPMSTIPEDGVLPKTPSPTTLSQHEPMSPSSGSWSWNPSPRVLDAPARQSYDQQISFEPHIESGRDSIGTGSRPSSEGFTRHWRHSLPAGMTGSAPSSVYSGKQNDPSSHRRHHLRNLAKRIRGRQYDSEDALSSRRNSLSEQSMSEDVGDRLARSRPPSRISSSRFRSPGPSGSERERTAPADKDKLDSEGEGVLVRVTSPGYDAGDGTPRADGTTTVPAEPPVSPAPVRRPIPRRRLRTSLPSSQRIIEEEKEKRQREVDEAVERQQYEQKAQYVLTLMYAVRLSHDIYRILEDARSQNHRTQQLLQRVAASVREYDTVQASMSGALGMPFARLPPEVLEAFSRDPSAFTSGTRSNRGWRAVEDVHERVTRQRRTLRNYAKTIAVDSSDSEPPASIFEQPMASLTKSLTVLEGHREHVVKQLESVTELLIGVRHTHKAVKKGYNDTMAHTSLIYPEVRPLLC